MKAGEQTNLQEVRREIEQSKRTTAWTHPALDSGIRPTLAYIPKSFGKKPLRENKE